MKIAALILVPLLVLAVALGIWFYDPDKPRAALEERYAAAPSQFIAVAGLRLHIRDTGPRDAPPLLLLHGFAASLHTWEDWAGALEADHRVIRVDLPGFGLTGPDPTGDYTDARTIAVLAALLDQLGLPRVTVIGSSMGGRIAWRFAAAEPARVERLVLIAPDGFASPLVAYDTPVRLPFAVRMLPYAAPPATLRRLLAHTYADPRRLTDAVVERNRDMLLAPGVRRAILTRLEQHIQRDPVPILSGLTMPVLLMWGARDNLIPMATANDFLAVLPHAALATLPTLGHVPFEEEPAVSLPPLLAFLGR
jgi:pimeloyl-ACP methyl ester carboxylesterase